MTILPYGPRWNQFAAEYDECCNYEFKYMPKHPSMIGDIDASVGVKFECCNRGWWGPIAKDIEDLSEGDWMFLQEILLDVVEKHECSKELPMSGFETYEEEDFIQ